MATITRRRVFRIVSASCFSSALLVAVGAGVSFAAPQSPAGTSIAAPSQAPTHLVGQDEPCTDVPPGPDTAACAVGQLPNTIQQWWDQWNATNGGGNNENSDDQSGNNQNSDDQCGPAGGVVADDGQYHCFGVIGGNQSGNDQSGNDQGAP
ncbi:hypothetical protein [Streptomyces sp. NBC_01483]|uniref:hypothetical protein n=1 Tax=Streptomyces sp. NBC_01483 TaxID=2903883 RepID=UPI002E331B66|nr:hypothetical protein [Streptomyces sp. NBC_01483]